MGVQVLHLFLIGAEQPLQVAGQVVHVYRALAKAQDFLGTVVAGNNDKRAAVAGVEHIVVGGVGMGHRFLDMRQAHLRPRGHESTGTGMRLDKT